MKFFLLICDENVFLNIFGLVAGPTTLGNSYNLHKSKMAAMNTLKNQLLNLLS